MYRNLKGLRAKFNLTQSDMAEILGISIVSYNQKEKGIKQFTIKEAKKISKYFNETLDYIFAA